MRLGVRDPGDILRWAGEQNTRRLDDFRHRVIRGREFVSFRMVPRYAIEIGTADIVVVAHVQAGTGQRVIATCRALGRRGEDRRGPQTARRASGAGADREALRTRRPAPVFVVAPIRKATASTAPFRPPPSINL